MFRTTLILFLGLVVLSQSSFVIASDESCDQKLKRREEQGSISTLFDQTQEQLIKDEVLIQKQCQGDAVCVEEKNANLMERALRGLAQKSAAYFTEKLEVIRGENIRTVSGPKRDFWMTLWLVYAYQVMGMATYEFNKGRFNISDIHFDVLPTTFVKLWLQKETQALKTSGLKDEVLNSAEIEKMKSGMRGFIAGCLKSYVGQSGFWKEVGNRLKGFTDLLPWGAAVMVGFRLAETAIRPDYQWSASDAEVDILMTVLFDGYLALRWSFLDGPMIRVFDSLKKCSSETCTQKYGRLFLELGMKSVFMSGDSVLFFYLRNDWLPAFVQSSSFNTLMQMFLGG